jgi:hypothetical protein
LVNSESRRFVNSETGLRIYDYANSRLYEHTNPFALPGHWFKGSLHIHSTASDGKLTPDEVVAWYRSRGYHFLALTDHNVLSEARSFARSGLANDFITLSGIEVDGTDPLAGSYHLVGLGLSKSPNLELVDRETGKQVANVPIYQCTNLPMQIAVICLRTAGGLVCLAHPYWSGQMSKDLLDLEGGFGLEIWNGGCEVDDAKGLSTVHWDDLLAAGRRLWGLAVDDAHWRSGFKDAGLGWVWVKAPALTQEAILNALEQGYFYASSRPQIHDLRLEGGQVRVRCSPVLAIDFIGEGPHSRRITASPGETLTEVTYKLNDRQRYVRVACQDPHGRWAWSNPFFFDQGDTLAKV